MFHVITTSTVDTVVGVHPIVSITMVGAAGEAVMDSKVDIEDMAASTLAGTVTAITVEITEARVPAEVEAAAIGKGST